MWFLISGSKTALVESVGISNNDEMAGRTNFAYATTLSEIFIYGGFGQLSAWRYSMK